MYPDLPASAGYALLTCLPCVLCLDVCTDEGCCQKGATESRAERSRIEQRRLELAVGAEDRQVQGKQLCSQSVTEHAAHLAGWLDLWDMAAIHHACVIPATLYVLWLTHCYQISCKSHQS